MDNGRCIITGVFPGEGVTAGFPQVSLLIGAPHPFRDGFGEVSPGNMDILADLYKGHSKTRVLTDRQSFSCGDVRVLYQFPEDLFPHGGFFF